MKRITICPKAQAKKKGKIDSSFMYLLIELDFNYKFQQLFEDTKELFSYHSFTVCNKIWINNNVHDYCYK